MQLTRQNEIDSKVMDLIFSKDKKAIASLLKNNEAHFQDLDDYILNLPESREKDYLFDLMAGYKLLLASTIIKI